jgi:hypothetical protein
MAPIPPSPRKNEDSKPQTVAAISKTTKIQAGAGVEIGMVRRPIPPARVTNPQLVAVLRKARRLVLLIGVASLKNMKGNRPGKKYKQ